MADKHDIPPLPSDRSFGITFTVVFAAIGAWLWWKGLGGAVVAGLLAAAMLVLSFVRPGLLRPLNRAWMGLAAILHRIVSPVVLGAIYFGMFTPIAFLLRLRGRDELRLSMDPGARSYWVPRDPPGPPPESLKNQF